jgi:hypothetical protein
MTDTSMAAAHLAESDLRVGSVFSRAAAVLSRHFLTFFIVTVISYLPILLLAMLARTQTTTDAMDPAQVFNGLASVALILVLSTLGEAIIAHAAFQDMRSRPVRPTESLNIVLRRFLPIVGNAFVAKVPIFLGFALLIIPGLILYTVWFVGLPACVVERLGPLTSLRRSWELTDGHRWKVFGLALLFSIAGLGSSLIEFELAAVAGPNVGLIGKLIWMGPWAAFATVVGTVTYHDLWVVKEGIDIEQIRDVFD